MADEKFTRHDQYRVVAPYVTLPQPSHGGISVVGLYEGTIIDGSTVPEQRLRYHLDEGMLEPIESGTVVQADPVDPDLFRRPAANAPHQAWVDYAVSRGWAQADALALNRADLVRSFLGDDADTATVRPDTTDGTSPAMAPVRTDQVVDDMPSVARGGRAKPAQNASKAEWVDYAVANGADRTAAEAATKDELSQTKADQYARRFGAKP